MDGSAFRHFPVGALMWLALIGAISIAVTAIGGAGWLIWFVINHVRVI